MRSDVPVAAPKSDGVFFSSAWPRYASIAIVSLLLGTMLWPLWRSVGESEKNIGVAPACARWDDVARESVASLVLHSDRDAELRQASDAIFRMRRARRNCDAGWIALACQDYLSVVRGVSRNSILWPRNQSGCSTTSVEGSGDVY